MAARVKDIGVDLLAGMTEADREAMEDRAATTRAQRKNVVCKKCGQPVVQSEWTPKSLAEMAEVNPHLAGLYGPCYLEPTSHHHATALGMERRLRPLPEGGYEYNAADYRLESRRALILAHDLFLRNLVLHNSRFALQLDVEIQGCVEAFPKVWNTVPEF